MIKYLLEGGSSVLVRSSGTETKLKTYISVIADKQETAKAIENKIRENLEKKRGSVPGRDD